MKIKEVRNGSLYKNLEGEILRARGKLNSSSISCSKPHSDDLVAVKAGELELIDNDTVESYLEDSGYKPVKATVKNSLPPLPVWRDGRNSEVSVV